MGLSKNIRYLGPFVVLGLSSLHSNRPSLVRRIAITALLIRQHHRHRTSSRFFLCWPFTMYRGQSFTNPPLETTGQKHDTTTIWNCDVHPGMIRSTASSSVNGSRLEQGTIGEVEWKPGKKEYAVMLTLALISLMVALDATILVSVLPVSNGSRLLARYWRRRACADGLTEASNRPGGHRNGCILGRDVVSTLVRSVPAVHGGAVGHLWTQGDARRLRTVLHPRHRPLRPHR